MERIKRTWIKCWNAKKICICEKHEMRKDITRNSKDDIKYGDIEMDKIQYLGI